MFKPARFVVLLFVAGCGGVSFGPFSTPPVPPCQSQKFSDSLEPSELDIGHMWREERDAGVSLHFGIARPTQLGAVLGVLHEPLLNGSIPRDVTTTAGCVLPEKLWWRRSLDDSFTVAEAALEVLDGGTARGDSLQLRFTDAGFFGADGGWRALDDFEAVLEVQ